MMFFVAFNLSKIWSDFFNLFWGGFFSYFPSSSHDKDLRPEDIKDDAYMSCSLSRSIGISVCQRIACPFPKDVSYHLIGFTAWKTG